jgi:hypothetical protein
MKSAIPGAFIFISLMFFTTGNIFSQEPKYRIGVANASSLFSHKEQYVFMLNGSEKITMDSANYRMAWFEQKLSPGQSYTVTQLAGPRACNIRNPQGTASSDDIILTIDCGTPPTTILRLSILGIEQGERFSFADDYGRNQQLPFNATITLGGFPKGDNYRLHQTGGPRPCKITNGQGIVPDSSITIQCD